MPLPEDVQIYGRTDLVPNNSPNPTPGMTARPTRNVTRTVTLHFTHGWRYNRDSTVHYWIDLDGSLYQNNEADRTSAHATGIPHFRRIPNATSVAVEICRFGKFREVTPGNWEVAGYGIDFSPDNSSPEWCDYSTMGVTTGSRRYNLWKIPGGDTFEADIRTFYKLKAAEFNDARNPERRNFPRDVLNSEEQYQTLVLWLKSTLERYRIAKQFLRDPISGRENPWIDTLVLARASEPANVRNEARERGLAHLGVWGHMNIQANRVDPGASMDYYRVKRGISDHWWYPLNLDAGTRALHYLDASRSADYLAMTEYRDTGDLEAYYRSAEESELGHFPIGANGVWHGGIHLNTDTDSREVYSMANGWIVAARVTNGTIDGDALPYSRCFVLVKHLVHTQDNGTEIDYGSNSAHVVYSVNVHLEPSVLTRRPDGSGGERWDFDHTTQPRWLCNFLIDNPTHATVHEGGIIYPNEKIELSDVLGSTGNYAVSMEDQIPQIGKTVHVEVFTIEDPNTFAENTWSEEAHRVIDPTPDDALADPTTIREFVNDEVGDGVDSVDLMNAAPSLRSHAVKARSAWSLDSKSQLGSLASQVSDDDWNIWIRPLCFHADIVADGAAPANQIGPYHGTTTVWHMHPLTFLDWMNERVDRHERILAEEDRPLRTRRTNLVVQNGYVTGFQNQRGRSPNQLPRATAGVNYPEATYGDDSFEVNVDALADRAALTLGAQTATRFNLRLLDVVDMCNDRLHGLQVVEGYVSGAGVRCSDPAHHAAHGAGNAVDLRPAATAMSDWFNLYDSAQVARDYMAEAYHTTVDLQVTSDPSGGTPVQDELDRNAAELLRRIEAASNSADPVLTALPVVQHLDHMRLHVEVMIGVGGERI